VVNCGKIRVPHQRSLIVLIDSPTVQNNLNKIIRDKKETMIIFNVKNLETARNE